MRTSQTLARLGALAFSLVAAAGCSSSRTTTQSTSTGAVTIRIGIDLALSGADASTGVPTRNGAVLAIEEANAHAPGGFSFAADDLDDAVQGVHDPAQGAQNVKAFVADPSVLAMIGPYNSNVARAEIPITNDAGLAQVSPATTNPGLTKGPDAAALRRSHPETIAFFRICATDDRSGVALAQYARKLGYSHAFVVDDDETYGKGIADVFEPQFKMRGGTIVGREHLTKGQTDFKALLTKAKALGPDLVFYGGTTATGGALLRKQMRDSGMSALPFFGGDGISDSEFETVAGPSADGTYFTVAAPEATKLPSAAPFVAAYRKRWGTDVGPYSANAYAAAKIEIAAIEAAIGASGGALPSRAAVLARIAKTTGFASPVGEIGFDARGDTTNPVLSVYEVANGKPAFVEQLVAK